MAMLQVLLSMIYVAEATKALPSFYHTTAQISNELGGLTQTCKGLSMQTVAGLDVVRYQDPETTAATNKAMVVAGEHARELIGVEATLSFVKALCESSLPEVADAKKSTEFLIVVSASPKAREMVEGGDFCRRVNEHGVDINRNFDINWGTTDTRGNPDTNPGEHAFSESQSVALKEIMEEFKPNTYLDIHSGSLGMFLPNAITKQGPHGHFVERAIMDIDAAHCNCPLGAANREVGYATSGSALDYSYEKVGTKFSMAVEIFVEPAALPDLRAKWKGEMSALKRPTSFLEVEKTAHLIDMEHPHLLNGMDPEQCLAFFNPVGEHQYQSTVAHWTSAIAELVAKGRDMPSPPSLLQTEEIPEAGQGLPVGRLAVGTLILLVLIFVATSLAKNLAKHPKTADEGIPLMGRGIQIAD